MPADWSLKLYCKITDSYSLTLIHEETGPN